MIELDVPGGVWTRRAQGAVRTRLTLGRTARPAAARATLVWLGDGESARSVEARFALDVVFGPR